MTSHGYPGVLKAAGQPNDRQCSRQVVPTPISIVSEAHVGDLRGRRRKRLYVVRGPVTPGSPFRIKPST